jgi:molybdopterin synthase catalytic subunit
MSQTTTPENKETSPRNSAQPSSSLFSQVAASPKSSSTTTSSASPPLTADATSSLTTNTAQYAEFALQSAPLDSTTLKALVSAPCTGAVVCFEGLVRDHNEGRSVNALTYEAFAPLCQSEAEKIFIEAQQLHPFHQAICHHRIGDLAVGDMAVYVAVSSPHRDEAFKACRYIIDEIKHRLPIWKKETYTDGTTVWVNCSNCQGGQNHSSQDSQQGTKSGTLGTKEHHSHGAH